MCHSKAQRGIDELQGDVGHPPLPQSQRPDQGQGPRLRRALPFQLQRHGDWGLPRHHRRVCAPHSVRSLEGRSSQQGRLHFCAIFKRFLLMPVVPFRNSLLSDK